MRKASISFLFLSPSYFYHLLIYQAGMPDWLLQENAVQKGDSPGKFKP